MTSNSLLKMLPPYTGTKATLVNDQNLDDVINGVVSAANNYRNLYQNIWHNFEGDGLKDTCRNVWNYLKDNVDYVIEPDNRQTIKTPSAIIATGKTTGSDCKNYALFSAGVLDAYRQAIGADFDVILRFAGYNGCDLQHVFCVVKKGNREIWIDPVLDRFNDRSQVPTKIKDYKLKNMALIALSGVNPYTNDKKYFLAGVNTYMNDKSYFATESNPVPGYAVGDLFSPSAPTQFTGRGPIELTPSKKDFSKSKFATTLKNVQSQTEGTDIAKYAGTAISTGTCIATMGAEIASCAAAVTGIVDAMKQLFAQRDNPQDYWKAWDSIDQQYGNPRGAGVQHWILFDGDSVQNEALNIISYIQANDPDLSLTLGKNSTTIRDAGRYVSFDDLTEKLRRGGFANEASQLQETYKSLTVKPDTGMKAGTNMFVTLALVGVAAFFLLKRK